MTVDKLLSLSVKLSPPPPGAINVRMGQPIEGAGGRWVPCATALADQTFVSCVYQVGTGQKQVCAAAAPLTCPDEALAHAIELAHTVAA